ncbi:MAG: M20/M25/M40 family metallo-hydrolase [Herpetosiphon sp.]
MLAAASAANYTTQLDDYSTDEETNLMERFAAHIEAHRDHYLADLQQFLRQPSIAAQGIGIAEMAGKVHERLERIGAKVQVFPMAGGAPVVYGSIGSGSRTLLVYDHYDVQPPEPLDGWTTPPFEPTIRDGKLYARGVADNKGNLLLRLQAVESWIATYGELPLKINFLIEGEEEIGSVHLEEFCQAHPELLRADGCLWETGGRAPTEQPLISCGAKGMAYVELVARGASYDLHSSNATVVPNPAWQLVWALGSLKTRDGRVLIPGFYDRVRQPSAADMKALEALPNDDNVLLRDYGIPSFINGVMGVDRLKEHLFSPTCTICGMDSGYTGTGTKTVLPAEARAKIDFRLVPDMDPHEIVSLLRRHLDQQGFTEIEIVEWSHERAARSSIEAPVVKAIAEATRRVYGVEPVVYPTMAGTGPMYPVCEAVGTPVVSGCGTGYQGTQIHAPNENIRLDDYWLAMRCMGAFIETFSRV